MVEVMAARGEEPAVNGAVINAVLSIGPRVDESDLYLLQGKDAAPIRHRKTPLFMSDDFMLMSLKSFYIILKTFKEGFNVVQAENMNVEC